MHGGEINSSATPLIPNSTGAAEKQSEGMIAFLDVNGALYFFLVDSLTVGESSCALLMWAYQRKDRSCSSSSTGVEVSLWRGKILSHISKNTGLHRPGLICPAHRGEVFLWKLMLWVLPSSVISKTSLNLAVLPGFQHTNTAEILVWDCLYPRRSCNSVVCAHTHTSLIYSHCQQWSISPTTIRYVVKIQCQQQKPWVTRAPLYEQRPSWHALIPLSVWRGQDLRLEELLVLSTLW